VKKSFDINNYKKHDSDYRGSPEKWRAGMRKLLKQQNPMDSDDEIEVKLQKLVDNLTGIGKRKIQVD